MNDWTQPSPRRSRPRRVDTIVGWKSRAIAALAAPPIFCVSLLIVSLPMKLLGIGLAMRHSTAVGVVALVFGAWLDLHRLPDFVGNVFLTNRGEERRYGVFVAYWSAVVVAAIVGGW